MHKENMPLALFTSGKQKKKTKQRIEKIAKSNMKNA